MSSTLSISSLILLIYSLLLPLTHLTRRSRRARLTKYSSRRLKTNGLEKFALTFRLRMGSLSKSRISTLRKYHTALSNWERFTAKLT